jgi:glycosyltransferase involved in cell wall biosynthesis
MSSNPRQVTTTEATQTQAEVSLSIVIPVFNEARQIRSTLGHIIEYLDNRGDSYEVLVADDGSTDGTDELVQQSYNDSSRVRVLRIPRNRGKGSAVQRGVLGATGAYVLFTDADLSAPLTEAERLLGPLRDGYDIAIGSRALKRDWIGVRQSRFRETAGKTFNGCIRAIAGLDFHDTQCGFKAFRREAAQAIFPRMTVPGFGFDVEILLIAKKFGFKTLEVPVHWNHNHASKIHPVRDGARMFVELLKIRWNDWNGKYTRG